MPKIYACYVGVSLSKENMDEKGQYAIFRKIKCGKPKKSSYFFYIKTPVLGLLNKSLVNQKILKNMAPKPKDNIAKSQLSLQTKTTVIYHFKNNLAAVLHGSCPIGFRPLCIFGALNKFNYLSARISSSPQKNTKKWFEFERLRRW